MMKFLAFLALISMAAACSQVGTIEKGPGSLSRFDKATTGEFYGEEVCQEHCDWCHGDNVVCDDSWNGDNECDCGCEEYFVDSDCPPIEEEEEEVAQECAADGNPCDFCHGGGTCPESWNNDGDCDCACANFVDGDCPAEEEQEQEEEEYVPGGCIADGNPCAWCHEGRVCHDAWNGDGECDCDCAAGFVDSDCPGQQEEEEDEEEEETTCVNDGNPCDYCHENRDCNESWKNDGDCDCECGNFVDPDCPGQQEEEEEEEHNYTPSEYRSAIYVSGDSFTEANGVRRGDGSPGNPYLIAGWIIDGASEGAAIYISNTSKCFTISQNRLEEAQSAIVLEGVSCAIVEHNTMESIDGRTSWTTPDDGSGVVAMFVVSSSNVTVRDNTIRDVTGGSGGPGWAGWMGGALPGGSGGDGGNGGIAAGIHASGSSNLTISNNQIVDMVGGGGGGGAVGGQGIPGGPGGRGGNGGMATGIHLENCSEATLSSNQISLNGGAGGAGGAGALRAARGGDGGNGGDVNGIELVGCGPVTLSGNQIYTLYAGAGAAGGAGAWGGTAPMGLDIFAAINRGGDGGSAGVTGSAYGVRSSGSHDIELSENRIEGLWGGAGPTGGAGGKGAGPELLVATPGGYAASGGAGGMAIALMFSQSNRITITSNRFNQLRGGAGAVGSAGGYAAGNAGNGGDGGSGMAGKFVDSTSITTSGNVISTVQGAIGGWGGAGAAGIGSAGIGGHGGHGGHGAGFYFENSSGIYSHNESCSDMNGSTGGEGGCGGASSGVTMAVSGDGGNGGDGACLVFSGSYDRSTGSISCSGCSAGSGGDGAWASTEEHHGQDGQNGASGDVVVH